ncbi:MAG: FecR domain-containing protein [Betaproteobacteria bacterium]|nr:FecR domain-containing protein [Betaproteobacteria bacterium]
MAVRNSVLRWVLGASLAAGAMLAHAETVGRVLLAAGDTFAVRDGKQVRLAFNSTIEAKDVLRTGAASSLQVRFADEGLISLRENSEFAIEEYRFTGKEDGSERGFFRLVRGGFRAVTGLIGRTQHDNYKVRAETATIGIRGTDYAVRDCRGDCGAGVKDGLYGTVLGMSSGTNQVTLDNNTGEHVFGINQHFHVPDVNSRPQPLLQPPSFVAVRPQGKAQAAQQGGSGTGDEQAGGSSGAAAESRPATTTDVAVTTPVITEPYRITQELNPTGTPVVLPPANGFVAVYPLAPSQPFGDVIFDDDVTTATFNGQNHLLSYGTLGTYPSGSLAGGTITDTGGLLLENGQTFAWGRWTGNTQVTIFEGPTLSGVPVLFGTASGLQQDNNFVGTVGGNATYNYAGGPKPVDAGGNVGSITSSSLTINFTQLTANYALGMSFPTVLVSGSNTGSATFSVSGTGVHASTFLSTSDGGDFIGVLSGTCSGSGCISSNPGGFFDVGFTGTQGYEFAVVPGVVFGTQAGDVAFLNAYTVNTFTPGPAPTGPLAGQVAWSHDSPSLAGTWSLATSNTVYNSSNQPISFNTLLSGVPQGSLGTGSIVETGSASLVDGGIMNWGRWQGGQITDPTYGVVTVNSGVPFVVGNANTTVPTSGSFVYNLAGGPNVVTNTGVVGGPLTSGAFQVNFGATQSISVASPLQFLVGGVSYNIGTCVAGCTNSGGDVVFGNMNLQGTCTGGACSVSSAASGSGAAFLVGPAAGGLAVAGNLFSPAPAVTFAGAFKR